MSGPTPPRRRHRLILFAVIPALIAGVLLSWLLVSPSPQLLCQLERVEVHAPAPLSGLTLAPLPSAGGLVVTSLRSQGSAERLGVRVGDEVESVDGRRVNTIAALQRTLKTHGNDVVSVKLRRGIGRYEVKLDRMVQVCRDTQDTSS